MTEYRIRKEDILGETDEPEEDYDLMSVIVIRMGEKSEERGIFDYLNQVFVGNIEEIETYSHIEWEEEFKEDVAMTMTGFSDVLVRRGREEGRKQGEVLKLITMVKKKIENGDSVAKIADDLLEDADVIEKIYDIVKENPEKTREEIWDSLMNDTMIEM